MVAASGLASSVVLTECREVLDGLRANVVRNVASGSNCLSPDVVSAQLLRWDCLEEDVVFNSKGGGHRRDNGKDNPKELQLRPHSFDTIIGTDVVFTPALVRPLLACMALMAHERANIYLCLQVRCADSHSLLLQTASKFGLRVEDRTDRAFREECPSSCSWGLDMDCKLLHITVQKAKTDSALLKRGAAADKEEKKMEKTRKKKRKVSDKVNGRKKRKKERRHETS